MKKKFMISFVVVITLLATILAPTASAATKKYNTAPKVQEALYAFAAYECISRNALQDTAIGNGIDSIIPQLGQSKVYVGQWLGDSDGMITCDTAFKKSLGSGKITEDMLSSGKIFNGVYEKDTSAERKIRCEYGIINSSASATISGSYSWPQGYFEDANGSIEDRRTHGIIEVVFDENGPIRLEGDTSDININHTLDSMKNINIKWSQESKICQPLVMYTEVYQIQAVNAYGESTTAYVPILATTDGAPFNEWLPGTVKDNYKAWVNGNSDKFKHYVTSAATSTRLKLKDNAKSKLLSNLAKIYTNGKTSVADFLNSDADAKYIVYGRYLFNGDGNGGFACNGTSVATDDPNLSNLNAMDYWDISQPYVAEVNAYENGSASNKTSYRTKFGGNGILEPGSARSITLPGVEGDCKVLAGEFNNINPTSRNAKMFVAAYMNVAAVEDLPEDNDAGTTGGGSAGNNISSDGGSLSSGDDDLAQCFNNASSLGWILCPVMKFIGSAADKLWEEMSSNWLVVDPDEYKANDSSTAYKAWTYFRNFANIAFAIFLTVVIISQLTGFGITNYGIKKLLPSLIIMAVLVNLSYFICQILIDVSNIAGASIGGILTDVQSTISPSSSVSAGDVVRGFLNTLFNAVGITGIGIAVAVTIKLQGLAAVMIPVLIVTLGAIISVVFVFLVLAVRQAGILVMVVISPLAIICYSLPNAKSLFEKWKKLFTALLFVYPVCSACIYGGQLVSSLMLNSDNTSFMYNLVGMLLQIVPIFFIPSLIRNSLALAGNIGNRISQLGRGLSNKTTGALRKSEAVERARTTSQYRAAQRNRDFFNRLSERGGLFKAIGKYGNRRMDGAVARYNKMRLDEHQAQLYGGSINEESIQRSLATLDRKDMERRVTEAMDNMVQDPAFDTTDPDKINLAFQTALAEVDADPTNETKMIRAKALASLLMGKGDTGQSLMIESMRNHAYGTTGVGAQGSEAMRALGGYISYNDKWMASIKGKDTGGYKFMNDLASNKDIKSASDYAMAGSGKVTQATIGGMGDSWYRSIEKALADGSFNTDATTRAALHTYADMATKALTDPRYAGSIQKERLETLNKLRQADYEMRRDDWLSANTGKTTADYEKEFGKFQVLENAGDKLVVPHRRAPVPTGWREDGTWIGGGSGPNRQQRIAFEEWARHAAEVDRMNSQTT